MLTAFSLFLAAACTPAFAGIDVPFEAVYQVYIDGKPRMETTISLARQDDHWVMSIDGRGTKGLPRMLRLRNTERSEGSFEGNRFQPSSYSHQTKVAGKDDSWSASFDAENNQIKTLHEHGESSLEPSAGTMDPLSLSLAVRSKLLEGLESFTVNIVDERDIDQHEYRAGEPENLETRLGCFKVTSVTRVRENSSRYSSGWYAGALEFIPLRLLHGKEGGKEFEMKIVSLQINDKAVPSGAECPA